MDRGPPQSSRRGSATDWFQQPQQQQPQEIAIPPGSPPTTYINPYRSPIQNQTGLLPLLLGSGSRATSPNSLGSRSPRSPRDFEYSLAPESPGQPSPRSPDLQRPVSPGQAPERSPSLQPPALTGLGISEAAVPVSPRPRPSPWHSPVSQQENFSPPHSPRSQDAARPPEAPATEAVAATPFSQCRISIAVDISGSTAGRILNCEREFIMKTVSQLAPVRMSQNVCVLPWNDNVSRPCQIQNLLSLEAGGGTNPVALLQSQAHLSALKVSNLWFLLTDGEIRSEDVNNLATTLADKRMHGIPCIIVIFDNKSHPPAACNISVGISPFAAVPNSALLYQDVTVGGRCHVLATKGCFNAFIADGVQPILDEFTTWDSLPTIFPESAFRDLVIPAARELAPSELALSDELTIDFTSIFETDLDNTQVNALLGNQTHLQSLLLSAQSRGQGATALSWLQRQNTIPQAAGPSNRTSIVDPVAANSIRRITTALQNRQSVIGPEFAALRGEIREAHRRNSQHLATRTEIIQQAIDSLEHASSANWAGSSLNRRREPVRITAPAPLPTPTQPDHADSYRGECPICFESENILAILFKRPQNYSTATAPRNKTLSFPLAAGNAPEYDIISAWLVCTPCSLYITNLGETPFRETATAALPLTPWTLSAHTWRTALSAALDYFSPPSQALLPILLLAIIDHHLRRKAWCIPDGSPENAQRANALLWLRNTIIRDVKMSGDGAKGPLGTWIKTVVVAPRNGEQGLIWKYPVDGFVLMLTIAQEQGADQATLTKTVWRKLLHYVTSRYVSELSTSDKTRMSAKLDAVMAAMEMEGWMEVLQSGRFRPVARGEVKVLRRLEEEMGWVEAVCGPAMRRWLGFLKEVGPGRTTVEAIWEIKGRWGAEAECVVSRPEDVVGTWGGAEWTEEELSVF